jgi:hypothetical protein
MMGLPNPCFDGEREMLLCDVAEWMRPGCVAEWAEMGGGDGPQAARARGLAAQHADNPLPRWAFPPNARLGRWPPTQKKQQGAARDRRNPAWGALLRLYARQALTSLDWGAVGAVAQARVGADP